ncbi:HAD-IIB family hydrolase [Magnetococcus sp. PR-3]|uniref:HAD-IIB family hydrolase n=1 Tax=Magnetococcus sp. PR-3 TaxID=3120355 RepID=UPI002FCE004D
MDKPLYIALISVHGLIRGEQPELGKDADTGGQITYVLDLARALGRNPKIGRVDLFTRQIVDSKVDAIYAQLEEQMGEKVRIIRFPAGPKRYLRKESLWPYLSHFTDSMLPYFRQIGQIPDVVHSHYSDAGWVGTQLARKLGVLHIHTGHSLGRVKKERLLEKGVAEETIEERYNINRRIEGEEITQGNASFIITSTQQEVDEQYALYDNYMPNRMWVMPPGVDLTRFNPPENWGKFDPEIKQEVYRFLRDPKKPMILALSRADERKNITTLIKAFGENEQLRKKANLVIFAGNRDDINDLDKGARKVMTEVLMLMDRYDLYGSMAIPKHNSLDDVPDLYRLAARKRGVFVNPALTEPFGLTLLEAAASGLPLVATHDGGPRDILKNCRNGVLIDPLNAQTMGASLLEALQDRPRWRRWSKNGLKGVHTHYTWDGHVDRYLEVIKRRLKRDAKRHAKQMAKGGGCSPVTRLTRVDRLLLCDLDHTLVGDAQGIELLMAKLKAHQNVGFGVATARSLDATVKELKKWKIPTPDFLITSVGGEIYYRKNLIRDESWHQHIHYRWERDKLELFMDSLPGFTKQPDTEQNAHKLSYYIDPHEVPSKRSLEQLLRQRDLQATVIYSRQSYLDLLPLRCSKGMAMNHLALKWGIPVENILAAGDSGNDRDMLMGNNMGIVVGNYDDVELNVLRKDSSVLFATERYARGILEGIEHFRFLADTIKNPRGCNYMDGAHGFQEA